MHLNQKIILVGLLCIHAICFANEASISKKINSLIRKTGGNINIGIEVKRLDNNKVIFRKNANRSFTPASTLKLFTAATTLLYLGQEYTYDTSLYGAKNKIHDNALNGNLYIKFSGDPTFSSEDLKTLLATLKDKHIKSINGNIYLDGNKYGGEQFGPGWMWDDSSQCYSAPLSSFILNHNCIRLNIDAKKDSQPPVIITAQQHDDYISYANLVTIKANSHCEIKVKGNQDNHYKISGCIPNASYHDVLNIAIMNPKKYIQQHLQAMLAEQDIHLTGKIVTGRTPSKAHLLVAHHSKPIRLLINTMLKESDNVIANTLFKTLGANYFHKSATWKDGAKAMLAILKDKVKLNTKQITIVDGSGLSRYNLLTPRALIQLLTFVHRRFDIAPEFMSALPIAGIDGTLHKRMRAVAVKAKVRAKTGTMKNVTALAGFLRTKNHKTLAFAILINGVNGPIGKYQRLQDKICLYLSSLKLKG